MHSMINTVREISIYKHQGLNGDMKYGGDVNRVIFYIKNSDINESTRL